MIYALENCSLRTLVWMLELYMGEKKWLVCCHTRGGGGFRGGLTFVTKKVVLLFEGFP